MKYCCPNCFLDNYFKELIIGLSCGKTGKCSFCKCFDVPIAEAAPESDISNELDKLISVFGLAKDKSSEYDNLIDGLTNLWKVFSVENSENAVSLLKTLFPDDEWIKKSLYSPIIVAPNRGSINSSVYNFFGEGTWDSFSNALKRSNRFHPPFKNKQVFEHLCSSITKKLTVGEIFYRARIWNKDRDPVEEDFNEPPQGKASNYRMNVEGIPCLYVADSLEAALLEVRAYTHDRVAVAKMQLIEEVEIIDLRLINNVSPHFVDCNELASNIDNLNAISKELGKPSRTGDSPEEYIPTQYISDYIKSLGYGGIRYSSVMYPQGFNVAFFKPRDKIFSVESINMHLVKGIEHDTVIQ